MNNNSKILSSFASSFSINFYRKITKRQDIFPFYHIVNDNPPRHVKHLYPVRSTNKFIEDLDFFLKHYKAESFDNIGKTDKPSFFLSFDDGLSEFYDIVAPILKEKGIPATFFVNSDFVDNKNLFFKFKISLIIDEISRNNISENALNKIKNILNEEKEISLNEVYQKILKLKYRELEIIDKLAEIIEINFEDYLQKQKPYLTSKQINELIDEGFTLGSHSVNHPLYSEISLQEQIWQTKESMKFIEEKFNIKNKYFAFPFEDNAVSTDFFNEIFIESIADLTFGTYGLKDDIIEKNIQRFALERTGVSAEKQLKSRYLIYFLRKLQNKHIIKR